MERRFVFLSVDVSLQHLSTCVKIPPSHVVNNIRFESQHKTSGETRGASQHVNDNDNERDCRTMGNKHTTITVRGYNLFSVVDNTWTSPQRVQESCEFQGSEEPCDMVASTNVIHIRATTKFHVPLLRVWVSTKTCHNFVYERCTVPGGGSADTESRTSVLLKEKG